MYSTLISCLELADHVGDDDFVVVDCRFSLDDPERGRADYERSHIPGAVYAHLNDDLSGEIIEGKTGRHPLPPVGEMADRFGAWGISEGVQVVAYDDSGGGVAARLWWMLQYLSHDAVAVLDGGWPRWLASDLPTRTGTESRRARRFTPRPRTEWIIDAETVEAIRNRDTWKLVDARDAERYRGEVEPIDPIAGHIPGALSAPFKENLNGDGYFREPEELRQRFEKVIGDTPADRVVSYCGSGVTAAHNLLAMAHAGLGHGRLYPGSWSEWIIEH